MKTKKLVFQLFYVLLYLLVKHREVFLDDIPNKIFLNVVIVMYQELPT